MKNGYNPTFGIITKLNTRWMEDFPWKSPVFNYLFICHYVSPVYFSFQRNYVRTYSNITLTVRLFNTYQDLFM